MQKRIAACIVVGLIAVTAVSAQTPSPGQVNYQQLDAPYLDQYTTSPTPALEQWFETHFMRMGVFSPYFDADTAWYTKSLFYDDLYAIYPGSEVYDQNPQWILHDQKGNRLYIPWGCSGGTCASFAGDISNPAFRAWWISNAGTIMNRGHYMGIWVDDVNMNFNVSDGTGNLVAPIDFNTGLPMTYTAWRSYVAEFTQQIRQSFPNAELCENTIWFAGPSGVQEADPYVQEQIRTATNLNLEQGVASNTGLTGGTGQWSVYGYFAYIDQVHALGVSVTLEEYQVTPAQQQYGLASYFMISNGNDRIGDATTSPVDWFSGYGVNLGTPLGPRTYSSGVFRRNFTNGIALLGEPGLAAQTITFPIAFTTLSGASVTSVTLSGSQGIILIGSTAGLIPPVKAPVVAPAPAPYSVLRYLSSLTPTYEWQSWGTPQMNTSVIGDPIRLDGVQYAKGLGVHAYSELHYALWGNCTSFTATVGVDDEIPVGLGSLAFQVWADGHLLYNSGTMEAGSPVGHVSVNLTGYQTLGLVVTNGIYMAVSGAVPDDHADWANAIVGCAH
jgi:hypothetical protein